MFVVILVSDIDECASNPCLNKGTCVDKIHSVFFFIRTSNFGAEAERSYIFLRFEAENVLKMFLNYMVYTTCISVNQCGRDHWKPIKVHYLLRYGIKLLAHTCAT